MGKEKLPAIQLYPGDWLKDEVSGCSLEAQGLWLRLMFVMHESERYGYLRLDTRLTQGDVHALARRCGSTPEEFLAHFTELVHANVPSKSPEGVYYSRRMVRDAELRQIRVEAGKKGGRPPSNKSKTKAKLKQNTEDEDEDEDEIPTDLQSNKSEILDWLAYKREKHQRYKPRGLTALWNRLRQIPVDKRKSAIEASMASNYSGIFPAKEGYGANKTPKAGDFVPSKRPV